MTKTYRDVTPEFFRELPTDQKAELAGEIRAFWHSLSHDRVKWANPDRDRSYVLSHFVEVVPESRRAFLDFMTDLPANDAERKARLDYIEYWNTDPTKTYRMGGTIFSVWFHVTDPTEMALVHGGVLVLIVLFTLGLFTRVTSVLVWLATVGVHPPHPAGAVRDGHDDEHPAVLPDDREQRGGALAGPADRALPRGAGQPAPLRAPSTRRRGRSWRARRRP